MKKMLFILLAIGIIVSATACGNAQKATEPATQSTTVVAVTAPSTQTPTVPPTSQPQTTAPFSKEAVQNEIRATEQPQEVTQVVEQPQEEQNMTLQMTIGNTPVEVAWEENEAVQSLKELCRNEPLTIAMSMYGGFEQVGSIGTNLPANDVQTTTSAGDIVLYSGNQMVVFYGSNTWAYTRLGHITDQSAEGMAQLLSNGDTNITINFG